MTNGLESFQGARAEARPDDVSRKMLAETMNAPECNMRPGSAKDKHGAGKDHHPAKDRHVDKVDKMDVPHLIIDHGHPMKGRFVDHWRDQLEEGAHKKFSPQEQKRLEAAIDTFEKRALHQNLSEEQVGRFYMHVGRLINGRDTNNVASPEAKKILAMQMVEQAAQPDRITQGFHNTCNVACAEHRVYSKHPEQAARLIADQILTGTYTTNDGFTLTPNRVSMKPEFDSLHPPDDKARSYASQVFQVTAVNAYWQKIAANTEGEEGTIRYVQKNVGQVGRDKQLTGEEMTRYGDGKRKIVDDSPDLTTERVGDIYNQIAGVRDTKFLLLNKHPEAGDSGQLLGSDKSVLFGDAQSFAHTLKDMKAKGQFPAVLAVYASAAPFDPGDNRGGWHVVNITSYDSKTGLVKIHNPWGKSTDVTIDYRELYKHTQE